MPVKSVAHILYASRQSYNVSYIKTELFTYSDSVTTYLHYDISYLSCVHFGYFLRKQKGLHLQKSIELKNFEA